MRAPAIFNGIGWTRKEGHAVVSNLELNNGQMSRLGGEEGPASGKTAAEGRNATDVFDYQDYRAYMRDRFAELQGRNRAFSQRGLARKARIANPGFFNEVIRGRRRLSPAATAKMAIGLELSPMETGYFSALVDYTETREPLAKLKIGRLLMALKNRRLYHAFHGMQPPTETQRQILQELEREWALQTAGLREDQTLQEGEEQFLDPISESTLPRILERLVYLRVHSGGGKK